MLKRRNAALSASSKKLVVLECIGDGFPEREPSGDGYLGFWPEPPYYYVFFDGEPDLEFASWLNSENWILRYTYRLGYDQWQQSFPRTHSIGPFRILCTGGLGNSEKQEEDLCIVVEPGVVFGSGLHGSTQGCLLSMAEICKEHEIRSAVDMGTGSGILAIAAAMLGVERVVAIDNNPMAAKVALKNIRRNRVEDHVHVIIGDSLRLLRKPSDLLIMNLGSPSLEVLLNTTECLAYRFVLASGFLADQWLKLRSCIPVSFRQSLIKIVDGWATILFTLVPIP